MGGSQFPILSEGAGEKSMLQVQIEGREIMMMEVDDWKSKMDGNTWYR